MVGTVGFDYGVMEIFRKHGVSYILKATNANSITHVVWDKSITAAFVEELENAYEVVTAVPSAIVCVIGTNIAFPGVLARATAALAENSINVNAVSQSLRQTSMQFVIDRDDYKQGGRRAQLGALPEPAGHPGVAGALRRPALAGRRGARTSSHLPLGGARLAVSIPRGGACLSPRPRRNRPARPPRSSR